MKKLGTIEDLAKAPYNPRAITDEAASGLAASLSEFGDIAGVTWNSRTGNLVCGHQRVDQLKALGAQVFHGESGPEIRVGSDGSVFPIRIVDWPLDKEKAANIAANNPHIAGVFTQDLGSMLDEVRGSIGDECFSQLQFDSLLEELQKKQDNSGEIGNTEDDETPEPPSAPVTKLGDLWLLGEHRLICGDSREAYLASRLFNSERASLMNTDPPYGVSIVGGSKDPLDVKNYRSGGTIQNDDITGEKLRLFLVPAMEIAAKMLVPGASWYVWFADKETRAFIDSVECLGGFRHILVWVKHKIVFSRCDYHYRNEFVMYGWVPGAGHRWFGGHKQDTVWEENVHADKDKKHPSSKPVPLAAKPIVNHTSKGEIVYDPFLGSGTTLIASEQLERRCYGFDIEPKYCDVIVERWQNLTGGKARLG